MSAFATFFGENFIKAGGLPVEAGHMEQFRLILLYFSAGWAPPCLNFTPVLKEFYESVKKTSPALLEVILVSFDSSEQQFTYSMHGHDWVGIPPEDPRTKSLATVFGVTALPMLVVVRGDGSLVTKEGRSDVLALGEKSLAAWGVL